MPIHLRSALVADAPAVADLLISSRLINMTHAPSIHPDDDVRRWVREALLATCEVTVAVDALDAAEPGLVGVLALTREADVAWVMQLHVAPTRVAGGIGTVLLAHALQTLPRPIRLYTFEASTAARRFYERHGFRPVAFGDGSGNEEGLPDVLYERTD